MEPLGACVQPFGASFAFLGMPRGVSVEPPGVFLENVKKSFRTRDVRAKFLKSLRKIGFQVFIF